MRFTTVHHPHSICMLSSVAPCCFQRRRDVIRVCDYDVSAACLQKKTPAGCVAEEHAGGDNSGADTAAGGSAGQQRNVVAIAVPVVVAGGSTSGMMPAADLPLRNMQNHPKLVLC